MNEVIIGIVGLVAVLALFLTGIELGFAMALIGFLGFGYIVSFSAASNLLAKDIFDVFASYGFTVIPLFVLMGQVAFNAGIAKRLFNASYKSRRSAGPPRRRQQPLPAWLSLKWIDMVTARNFRRGS
jgi:C4-dicarboxylate transporter DctM subunit